MQLHDLPSPPAIYRAHEQEPALDSTERVRIITGYSGSGKTSWVAQVALHSAESVTYLDVVETPGPVLVSTVARELAARLFGGTGGALGELLLPGTTGLEILKLIGARLAEAGKQVIVILDNAHRVPSSDLKTLIQQSEQFKFVLLCQPGRSVRELEALLAVTAFPLGGWATDTIAREVAARGCRADYATCARLSQLTAAMPLYVQNAIAIAATEYEGSVARFCDELDAKTHAVDTAQELILARVFEAFSNAERQGIAILSLCDIPLAQKAAEYLLMKSSNIEAAALPGLFRRLRSSGPLRLTLATI